MDWQVFGLSSLRQRARQRRFPPEFRIFRPALPIASVGPAREVPAIESDLDDAVIADVATNLWRSLKRFEGAESESATRLHRMTTRNLRAIAERLDEAGVRIHDHDGLAFDLGMALEVVAYEPRPNLERETVVETVRPSIYRAGRRVQIGQVIVGMPTEGNNDGSRDD
jgi:hypothetical protein